MKTTILLLATILIASCSQSKEEEQIINPITTVCNIWAQIESRTTFVDKNGTILQQNDWRNINQPFYYSSKCEDNNTIVNYKKINNTDSYIEYRTRLYKK